MTTPDTLEPSVLGRLRWSCRRGLLENDLLIGRFLDRHGAQLGPRQAEALTRLMALTDNELLDLLLQRTEPEGSLDTPDVHEVLRLMRPRPSR